MWNAAGRKLPAAFLWGVKGNRGVGEAGGVRLYPGPAAVRSVSGLEQDHDFAVAAWLVIPAEAGSAKSPQPFLGCRRLMIVAGGALRLSGMSPVALPDATCLRFEEACLSPRRATA